MRNPISRPLFAAALSLCAFPFLSAGAPVSRPHAPAAAPDTAQLRRALAASFGEDLQIVRTELSSGLYERGGTFWLVHARPLRSGDFELRYRYEYRDHARPDNPLYTHVEHTSYIRVGERGCWRRREGRDACLGDTVILPFVVNDYTGHTFSLTWRGPATTFATAEPSAPETAAEAVSNPLAAHLRYLGNRTAVMLHRRPGSTTVVSAEFEAVAPGSFNLFVGAPAPDGSRPPPSPAAGSIPVVIVPRGQPVTVLMEHESVVGRDEKNGFSSHSGNQYLTTVLLLQPGDRITLEYQRYTSVGRDGPVPLSEPPPVIARFPFRLNTGERFNAWIAAHLPVEHPLESP